MQTACETCAHQQRREKTGSFTTCAARRKQAAVSVSSLMTQQPVALREQVMCNISTWDARVHSSPRCRRPNGAMFEASRCINNINNNAQPSIAVYSLPGVLGRGW